MPFEPAAAAARRAPRPDAPHAARAQLAQACQALWLATLSLMTAFMHQPAPAHRLLLARRIARNLATLAGQPDVFGAANCARFEQLGARWQARAAVLSPDQDASNSGRGRLNALARLVALPR